MERFITLTFLAQIRVFRIVCIRVQWNHPELAGVPPGVGLLTGRLLGNWGWVRELSRAEEPVDRHWTGTVVGALGSRVELLVSSQLLITT